MLEPDSHNPELTRIELGVAAATDQMNTNRDYPEHIGRMLDSLPALGYSSDFFVTAAIFHDYVGSLVGEQPSATEAETAERKRYLYEQYASSNLLDRDRQQLEYGIGIGMSQARWERAGKSWRGAVAGALTRWGHPSTVDDSGNKGKAYGFSDQILNEIADKTDKSPTAVRNMLVSAIINREADEGKSHEMTVLREFRPTIFDTETLLNMLDPTDIEAFVLGGVELRDKIRHPKENATGSTWRDCIEGICFFAPALELLRFDKLAAELRGEALGIFYPDSPRIEQAKAQLELSQDNADSILEQVTSAAGAETEITYRVKTLGSYLDKYSREHYRDPNIILLNDGIGVRVLVPDDLTEGEVVEFAAEIHRTLLRQKDIHESLTYENDLVFDDKITGKAADEYRAIHLSLAKDVDGKRVPFEIQVLTHEMHESNTFGPASHIDYKFSGGLSANSKDHLEQLQGRSRVVVRQMGHETLNPHTWFDMFSHLPELQSPMHRIFRGIDQGEGRVMVPTELVEGEIEIPESLTSKDAFLPPLTVESGEFMKVLSRFEPNLAKNEKIIEALELAKKHLGKKPRKTNPELNKLESHVLPVAIHTAMMLQVSGERFIDYDDESVADLICAAILHDIIEDTSGENQVTVEQLTSSFGNRVADDVDALTKVKTDGVTNIEAYKRNLERNPRALLIKLSDRLQNHVSDIVGISQGLDISRMEHYLSATESDLEELFNSLHSDYINTYHVVRAVLRKNPKIK
ncbi:HD domain-containing protein [Candidatus Saccharibacteria bacterium]|jgi:hypothetical protein|nr:HD domain-containing protein [Candidatus Saccharibacteria bacterium]